MTRPAPQLVTETQAPAPWFLATAMLVGANGKHTAISSVTPGEDIRQVRSDFIDHLLGNHAQQGWAILEVNVTPLDGLVITRAEASAATQD
jgi:hypothetical protein